MAGKKNRKAPAPVVRSALIDLARHLGDETVAAEVAMSLDDPEKYLQAFEERCADLDVETAADLDPWTFLIRSLSDRNRAIPLDWKATASDVQWAADGLTGKGGLGRDAWAWYLDSRYDQTPTPKLLGLAGGFLEKKGFSLLYLELGDDSYPLTVQPRARAARARELAKKAKQLITVFTAKLPADAGRAPRKTAGPRIQRMQFKELSYGICGEPHDGVVCLGGGVDGSEWLDLRVWPPKRQPWKGSYLFWASGGGPGGRWALVDRLPDAKTSRVVLLKDPFKAAKVQEIPFVEPPKPSTGINRADFVGDRLMAFPWSGETAVAYVEEKGRLRPAKGLSAAERSLLGVGRTGAGPPVFLWKDSAWEPGPGGKFVPFGPKLTGSKDLALAPADGDGFYLAQTQLLLVRRGAKAAEKPCGERRFIDVQPGPPGSILLTQNNYDEKPALAWVYYPRHDMAIRIERKLLGLRETHWIVWSRAIDSVVVCIGNHLIAVPAELIRTLPQIQASTGKPLKTPIPI